MVHEGRASSERNRRWQTSARSDHSAPSVIIVHDSGPWRRDGDDSSARREEGRDGWYEWRCVVSGDATVFRVAQSR